MLLLWSSLELGVALVAFCCFSCGLGSVTGFAEPLQVGVSVVIALPYVVGVCALTVALWLVVFGLALSVGSASYFGADLGPAFG